MNPKAGFFIIGAFILGIVCTMAITAILEPAQKSPVTTTTYVMANEDMLDNNDDSSIIARVLGMNNLERASPYDWIGEQNIHVEENKVIINIKDAEWSKFTDTNSMDPVIDAGANAIQIVPDDISDIHVGDIVSYKSDYADGTIIHRVIETGYDDKGWYCMMKGDNNNREDPGKIRFSQIKRVVVAIIY